MVLRILAGIAGLLLVTGAAAAWRWWARVRRLPAHRRPEITWTPAFVPAATAGLALAAVAGLGLATFAHPLLGAAVVVALAVAATVRTVARSPRRRRRALARDAARWGADRAGFVRSIHPEWGKDLAEQLAADCATPEDLADWVVRLEERL